MTTTVPARLRIVIDQLDQASAEILVVSALDHPLRGDILRAIFAHFRRCGLSGRPCEAAPIMLAEHLIGWRVGWRVSIGASVDSLYELAPALLRDYGSPRAGGELPIQILSAVR